MKRSINIVLPDGPSRKETANTIFKRTGEHGSVYAFALEEPTISLIGKTNERPEVAYVAVLGYN
ncbi:hypothetical protein A9R05_39820 (plasmid) [Burkholderia sp. KK1]|nr:hypothetical protein A9R05_39820 [Burkholderia sp. KK1]